MKYVKMERRHIDGVAQLEKRCFNDPWSVNSIAAELDNSLSLWLIAEDDEGRVAGYVGSQSVMGWSDMMNLAVAPEYRRMGIGKMLVETLVEHLRDAGNTCLTLEVRQSNAQAIGLYSKLGFVQVGCRPNYYSNPKEDALILRKEWEK